VAACGWCGGLAHRIGHACWRGSRASMQTRASAVLGQGPAVMGHDDDELHAALGKDRGEGLGWTRPEKKNGTAGEGRG
jgi:hypothetical protein